MRFEAILGCSDDTAAITVRNAIDAFYITTTTMPAAGTLVRDDTDITTALPVWEVLPADLVDVPVEKYFSVRSQEIALDANAVVNVLLTFNSAILGSAAGTVYLYAFRPVVELT